MPTYEYACEKCGKNFDFFQSMRDEPLRECPADRCPLEEWGHGKVRRLLGTGAGLIFKGSGFYITDYRSNSYKEAAKKDAPASGSTGDASSKENKAGSGTPSASPAPAPAEKKSTKPAAE